MGLSASADADEEASLGRSSSSIAESGSPHASDLSIPSPPTLANRLPRQVARGPHGPPSGAPPASDRSRVPASQRSLASQRSMGSSSFVSGTQRSAASRAGQALGSARSPEGSASHAGDQTGRSLMFTERSSAYYTESANTERSMADSARSGDLSGDYTERSARSGQDTERSDLYTGRSGGGDYTNRSLQYTGRSSQYTGRSEYSEYTARSGQETARSGRSSDYSRIEEEEDDESEYTPQFSGSVIEILSLSRSRSGSITGSQCTGSQAGRDTFRSVVPESHRGAGPAAASDSMGDVFLPTDANKSFRVSSMQNAQDVATNQSTGSMGMFSALVAAAGHAVAALEGVFEGNDHTARLAALRLKVVDMRSAQQAMSNEYLQLVNEMHLLRAEHKRLSTLAEELSKQ